MNRDGGPQRDDELYGKWGRVYFLEEEVSRQVRQARTPTITYTRLVHPRPTVWKAFVYSNSIIGRLFTKRGRQAMVKVSPFLSEQLVNEARALERLQKERRKWPFRPRIAPRIYQGITRDRETGFWFFATEWLELKEAEREWKYLSDILRESESGTLATADLLNLKRALDRAVRCMHGCGVVHGDIKDEHIVVRVIRQENGEEHYDFSDVRLVDFGSSYLLERHVMAWNGATPGFCPPSLWDDRKRRRLDRNELRWLDRYGADAVLYLALTGEHFPIAAPPYRALLQEEQTGSLPKYLHKLRVALFDEVDKKYEIEGDWPRRALAYWLIRRLSVYDRVQEARPFYRKMLLAIVGKGGWVFLGGLLGSLFIARYFMRAFPLWAHVVWAIGIGGGLVLWRERWQRAFFVNVRGGRSWLSGRPLWEEIMMLALWVVGGITLLPPYLFPTVPVVASLFTRGNVGRFVALVLMFFGSLAALRWRHHALVMSTGWTVGHLLSPVGVWALWSTWMVAFGIPQLRFRATRLRRQWQWVIAGITVAWLLLPLGGKEFLGMADVHFMLSGLASLAVAVLGGMYATWSVVDVDPDKGYKEKE